MYQIAHKYREEIVIPMAAISDNIKLLTGETAKGAKCITSDDKLCAIEFCEEINMLDPSTTHVVWRLYGLAPYEFMQRWYMHNTPIDSIFWMHIRLTPFVAHNEDK